MIDRTLWNTYVEISQEIEILKTGLDAAQEKFNEEHKSELSAIEGKTSLLNACKEQLKENGLEEFQKTGLKMFDTGMGIREMNKIEYDSAIAKKWAEEHKMFLTLDTKKFESFAKDSPEQVPFVSLRKEPLVTFPSKLVKVTEVEHHVVSNKNSLE